MGGGDGERRTEQLIGRHGTRDHARGSNPEPEPRKIVSLFLRFAAPPSDAWFEPEITFQSGVVRAGV